MCMHKVVTYGYRQDAGAQSNLKRKLKVGFRTFDLEKNGTESDLREQYWSDFVLEFVGEYLGLRYEIRPLLKVGFRTSICNRKDV